MNKFMDKGDSMMVKSRHKQLGLTDETVLDMYRTMLLARKFDKRLWLLNRAGKIPFVVSGRGQEATQIAAAFALDRNKDYVAPYYRDLALVLALGMTPKELMLSNFAKQADPNSGGRQMPGHYGQRKNRIITGSSPVTTQVPHAVGFALAAQFKQKDFVTLVTLGEGSTNQGDFHEGLNFAGVHNLPVITLVQNNKYAISVPLEKQVASENISIRAKSYGMPGYTVDGNNIFDVYEVMKKAHDRAKSGQGPTLIEAVTDRMTAHSSDDNEHTYRSAEELEQVQQNDCLKQFKNYLLEVDLLNEDIETNLINDINTIVDKATDFAENAPNADPETLFKYVYEESEETAK